jgi:predicted DNA-binding transcriptional regulator AlpA
MGGVENIRGEIMISTEPRFYRIGEVATLLGVAECTVYRWIKRGLFVRPAVTTGINYWSRKSVEDWLRERTG